MTYPEEKPGHQPPHLPSQPLPQVPLVSSLVCHCNVHTAAHSISHVLYGICHNLGFICYDSFIQLKKKKPPMNSVDVRTMTSLHLSFRCSCSGDPVRQTIRRDANRIPKLSRRQTVTTIGRQVSIAFQTVKSPMCFRLVHSLVCSTDIARAAQKAYSDRPGV